MPWKYYEDKGSLEICTANDLCVMYIMIKYFTCCNYVNHHLYWEQSKCSISGEILELETVTQSEAMRRRYRYLSHFSLTTTFQVVSVTC